MDPQFRFNPGLAVLYFILLILAVPWYWPADETRLLFGLPVWVLAASLLPGSSCVGLGQK